MITLRLFAVSLLFIGAFSVSAQTTTQSPSVVDQSQEELTLEVIADRISKEKIDNEPVRKHEGNVKTRLWDCYIESDSLKVFQISDRLIAEGNVHFTKGNQTIEASRIEWDFRANPNKITITF